METQSSWNLISALLSCPTMRTMLIWGPPGIGKSYSAFRHGLNGRQVYKVTLTEDTPAAELRGHYIPHGGEFRWHDGVLTRAMREGARLVLDEVSHASMDVQSLLYCALESPDSARLTLPTGETIRPAPGYQVILTDNADPAAMPAALRDRCDAIVKVSTPHPDAILGMPENIRALAAESASVDDPARRITLRAWESLARLMDGGLDLETAGQAVHGARWEAIGVSLISALAAKA